MFDFSYDILMVYTIASAGILGFVLAAWAAFASKFPSMGAVREIAQMCAYELVLGFTFLVVIFYSGALSLKSCVEAQGAVWFCF